MLDIDIVGWVMDALTGVVTNFLDWVVQQILLIFAELLEFNPIDLRADWWRSEYATLFRIGLKISAAFAPLYALNELRKRNIKGTIGFLFLTLKVLIVCTLIPTIYGMLLQVSDQFSELFKLGYTNEELAGTLDLFDGLNVFSGAFYAFFLGLFAVVGAVEIFAIQYITYMVGMGAAFFYATKDFTNKMGLLWSRTVTFAVTVLVARPVMILIRSLGYLMQDKLDAEIGVDLINPAAMFFLVVMGLMVMIPYWMVTSWTPQVDAMVRGGRLNKVDSSKSEVVKNDPGLLHSVIKQGADHVLENRTARKSVQYQREAKLDELTKLVTVGEMIIPNYGLNVQVDPNSWLGQAAEAARSSRPPGGTRPTATPDPARQRTGSPPPSNPTPPTPTP